MTDTPGMGNSAKGHPVPDSRPFVPPPPRFGGFSERPVVRGLVDVTTVGLLGGPRLAIRAARAFLADSYAVRSSEHEPAYAGQAETVD